MQLITLASHSIMSYALPTVGKSRTSIQTTNYTAYFTETVQEFSIMYFPETHFQATHLEVNKE